MAEALLARDGPIDPPTLREETGLSQTKLGTALSRLEDVGAIELVPSGEVSADGEIDTEEIEAAAIEQEHRREFVRSRVEMMRGYAEVRECRRGFLLNYFGELSSRRTGTATTALPGSWRTNRA